jgi:hypothetical protein
MGSGSTALDPSRLTRSGVRCLEELVQIALLAYEARAASEWLIVTCVTCIEAHLDRIIDLLISASDLEDSKFGGFLLSGGYDEIFRNWETRLKCLDKGFGISIAGDRPMQDCRTLVELRHAIVHGQGNLTTFQQANFVRLLDLKRKLTRLLDVQFSGLKILLPADMGPRVSEICRSAAISLDRAVLAQYPSIGRRDIDLPK